MKGCKRWTETLTVAIYVLLLAMGCATTLNSGGKGDYRITAAQLKKMLGSPNLLIVDVRDPVSWASSDTKILGAVREDPRDLSSWARKFAKNKTIVFYCA